MAANVSRLKFQSGRTDVTRRPSRQSPFAATDVNEQSHVAQHLELLADSCRVRRSLLRGLPRVVIYGVVGVEFFQFAREVVNAPSPKR
jgi:hypothetical protein